MNQIFLAKLEQAKRVAYNDMKSALALAIDLDTPHTGVVARQRRVAIPTRMLNKKQALEVFGVAPTNPIKNEVFEMLPKYDNRFNQHAVFREEDVISLLRSFPLKL